MTKTNNFESDNKLNGDLGIAEFYDNSDNDEEEFISWEKLQSFKNNMNKNNQSSSITSKEWKSTKKIMMKR